MRTYKIITAFVTALIFTFSFDMAAYGQRQDLQSVRQKSSDANQRLSSQTTQTASKKIQWQTNLYGAYSQALSQNKPLVAYFHVWNGEYCRKLENGPLMSAEVNSLADKAVFVRVDVETEDAHNNVSRLIHSLNLQKYPTVVVMDVFKDKIQERGRVTGFFETSQFYFNLTRIFLKR